MSEGEYKKPKVKIAIFDGTGDFPMWKKRMLAHLSLNDLEEEVLPLTEEPEKLVIKKEESQESYAERVKADQLKRKKRARHAMDVLTLHLGDQVVRKTEDCTNARDLWKALERLYNTKTLPSRIHLMYTFYTFKMDGSKSIDQNVDDWLKNMHELASVGAKVPDEVQAILLLASLPPQYDPMKESLKYGRESITIDDVVNAAKAKEVELRSQGISTSQKTGEAYVARGRQQNRDQRGGSRSRSRSKSSGGKLNCWYCHKDGHRKIDCYAWKKKKGMEDDEDATAAVVIDQSIGVDALLVSENWHLEKWVIDSGASYHMTSRRDWFDTFEELNSGRVLLADDGGVAVEGIGSININTKRGTVKTLTNVRYVPKLKRNLISATTLDKLGFSHAGGNGKTRFYKNGKLGLQGSLCGSLYLLDGETVTGQSNISVSGKPRNDETVLWHRRLGHMSMKNLMILVKRGILDKRS